MTDTILNWYKNNKRNLAFRETLKPYNIWISEVIMQQTKVEQGIGYYKRFLSAYPDVNALASASPDDVMRLWQGLGYYSRARNLLYSAKYIVDELGGEFPKNFEDIKKLKGVGEYTAAAIASIAFNENVPAVDGNVYRVLSRLYAESTPIDSSLGKKLFRKLAEGIIDPSHPGDFNQAMMELGALVCTPKSPRCIDCPIVNHCHAYASETQLNYPVKKNKTKQTKRYFNVFIVRSWDYTYIYKREKGDIWQGLYQFPLVESTNKPSVNELLSEGLSSIASNKVSIEYLKVSDEVKHILSHQILHVRFIHVIVKGGTDPDFKNVLKVKWSALSDYAMPRLITRHLEELA